MKNTDILIFTTGQGHESLAKVVAETITTKTKFTVGIFKYFPDLSLHVLLHRYAPRLMRLLSKPIANKHVLKLSRFVTGWMFEALVEKQLKKHQPKVVISTFYLLNPALERLKKKYNFYFINLITDPKTMILMNPSPQADVNFVFDRWQAEKIVQMYPQAKTKVVGWFVKPIFEEVYQQQKLKKELGFKPEIPLFLLSSGSLGNIGPAQFLPKFLTIKKPLQVVMICGSNEFLKDIANGFKSSFLKNKNLTFKVFGFTDEMDKYMKAADLVIGKSGPNTLFEATATLTPFMAINYGGAQEKGNQELIINYQLGLVENQLEKAWQKLEKFIDKPSLLLSYKPNLQKVKTTNINSKELLLAVINQALSV
ncbi:MAG: glycosyltransferase [Patescibacteria group bacterium]